MKYKTIKSILKKQVELKSKCLWAWVGEEFTCVFNRQTPKGSTELYTPKQLLKKINKESN